MQEQVANDGLQLRLAWIEDDKLWPTKSHSMVIDYAKSSNMPLPIHRCPEQPPCTPLRIQARAAAGQRAGQ